MLSVSKSPPLRGTLRPPSDKSLTHRAYIFAALARTPSTVHVPLRGQDCEGTRAILGALGAKFTDADGSVHVDPSGFPSQPNGDLDCGNSGTTMRLLAGVLAGLPGIEARLTGDESLSRRPMGRVIEPLRLMGADIDGETAPLTIRGKNLRGVRYESPIASAQVKSAVLLAGLMAEGETWVSEPSKSRDHTERMLTSLGIQVEEEGGALGVQGGQTFDGFEVSIPADVSSAAFWLCAASIVPGSFVVLRDVGTNPTRTGVLEALASAGATIGVQPQGDQMGEPVSTIAVQYKEGLEAFEVKGDLVPRLIDEIPVLAVLATQCTGRTMFRDARELRVKETDRIETVVSNLAAMGAKVEAYDDGLSVVGPTPLEGKVVDARGDHRIGMAFAVAGLIAEGETRIENADSISTSYPGFVEDLRSLTSQG